MLQTIGKARWGVGGGGSGGYSQYFWVEVCCPVLETLTLFQTKIYDFPHPNSDLTLKMIVYPISDPARGSGNKDTGPHDTPNNACLLLNYGTPDQTHRIYTLFQTNMAKYVLYFRLQMLENDTLKGSTIPI